MGLIKHDSQHHCQMPSQNQLIALVTEPSDLKSKEKQGNRTATAHKSSVGTGHCIVLLAALPLICGTGACIWNAPHSAV